MENECRASSQKEIGYFDLRLVALETAMKFRVRTFAAIPRRYRNTASLLTIILYILFF